jgi:hypothetical protein
MKVGLVLLCASCGGLPADAAPWQRYPIDGPNVAFSCAPENEAALRWVVERWNTATGWNVSVGPEGVPLRLPAVSPDGRCGEVNLLSRDEVVVSVETINVFLPPPDGCEDTIATLTHEVGHVICGGDADACHSAGGVMGEFARRGAVINQSTLDAVCARWGCPAPQPELGFTYPAPLVVPAR